MDRLSQALELERAPIGKGPASSGRQLANGRTGQDLAGSGRGHQPSGDMDGDPGRLAILVLDLAGMEPDPDGEPECGHLAHDLGGSGEGVGRSGERREEAVAGGVLLVALGPPEGGSDNTVVTGEDSRPGPVTETGGLLGRADDVAEEHRPKIALPG